MTQQFKLVGSPGTFSREDFDSAAEAKLELYDLLVDRGETNDLAATKPAVLRRLKTQYEEWFADVRASREFAPGVVEIGHPQAESTHLCRYQDGSWVDGRSTGWPVRVVTEGRYRAIVRRGETPGSLRLRVRWQGDEQLLALDSRDATELLLTAGTGLLEIFLVDEAGSEVEIHGNGTAGDVTLAGPLQDAEKND